MWQQDPALFFLTDPFSFPIDALLARISDDHPGVKAFGGVADGASRPGDARLLLGKETFTEGGIAVMITGVAVESVVSQGCRPIGEPHIVTSSERNEIGALGGRPAFDVLKSMYDRLPTQDKAQVEQGLHLGIAMTELKDNFEYGDFLIRNVIGIDEDAKSFALSDYVRMGKTVQFHIRDARSASAELESMLKKTKAKISETLSAQPRGALVFSCNGRGSRLFSDPHHDAGMIRQVLGEVECAGFFAAGEIGSVGDQAFLHGFTASVAVFE
jgi:small ligand-binding sensory domain FIST